LTELRKSARRIDLFTFIQKLPGSEPQYRYPMEWDNQAVVELTSFDQW